MNYHQIAKLESYKLMVYEANANESSSATIPVFAESINKLNEICIEIDDLHVEQEKDITGVTEDKNQILTQLIELMADVAYALQTYAKRNNNNTLYERVEYSEATISKLRHAEISSVARIFIEEVKLLTPEELTAYGLSEEDISELIRLKDEYKLIVQTPRQSIIERSSITEKIKFLFDEAYDIKKNVLDKLANRFKRKDPEFYLKFNAASSVIYRSNHKSSNGEGENAEEESE